MKPFIRSLCLILTVTAGLSSAPAEVGSAATLSGDLEDLINPDYEIRYTAARWAAESEDPKLDQRLAELAGEQRVRRSPLALAAVEFVRWKRSGRKMPPGDRRDPDRPNVLLISIDTLRPDRLSCYGNQRPTSPNIDALAKRGVLFENAYSPTSWTLPGHMSIFTSLYPSFHKLDHNSRLGTVRLDDSERTLTELLKGSGFRTASFVTHPFLSAEWGFGRGFDLYVREVSQAGDNARRALNWLEWHQFHERRGLEPSGFFLFLHFIDPHETYNPPPPFLDRFTGNYQGKLKPTTHLVTAFLEKPFPSEADYRYTLALYDGEINYVDSQIGRIRQALDDAGWLDSTVIVVTSDHGEEFKDHGSMGHKTTLYDEQLRVPLIISYPPRFASGLRLTERASLLDIHPTVLGLLGETSPAAVQGLDLGPLLTGKPEAGAAELRRQLAARPEFGELGPLGYRWERAYCRRSIRQDRYKLIINYPSHGDITRELFDLKADPGEQRDLLDLADHEQDVRTLEERLSGFIKAGASYNAGFRQRNRIKIDKAVQEKLRSLGYID